MLKLRHLSLTVGALACCFAAASGPTPHASAPVMPEARKFIESAQEKLAAGAWDNASAIAGVVLIADEVAVNVNTDGVPKSQHDACMHALKEAFSTWETALDNSIKFRIEEDPSRADVVLKYRPDVRMKRDAVAGLTTWKRVIHTTAGRVTDVCSKTDVLVRTRDLNYRAMAYEAIRQATEHELGHVLGLDDSSRVGDLMGELDLDHLVSGPRQNEIQAVDF